MSTQLLKAFNNILKMKYTANEAVGTANAKFNHEDLVVVELVLSRFSEIKKGALNFSRTGMNELVENEDPNKINQEGSNMPNGTLIRQPCGSQSFPDILIKDFCGRFVALECKSNKSSTIMWNDSLPKSNGIYIFCSKKENQTTFFMGKDVISKDEKNLMKQQEIEMLEVSTRYRNKLVEIDQFNRGWIQKARKQHYQVSKKRNHYFNHPHRKICERNVIEYVRA